MTALGKWTSTILAVAALSVLPAGAQAAFPGQAGKIAFAQPVPGTPGVFTAYPNGSALTRLADGGSPAWSADGEKIAFTRPVSGEGVELFVMDQDGNGQTRVTPPGLVPGAPSDHWAQPAWSPDGTKLVFATLQGEACDLTTRCLFTINVDGTGFQLIGEGTDPVWSPDGARIAFSYQGQIWTMMPDGTDRTQVTTHDLPGDAFFTWPDWSPDGSKIVFSNCDPNCDDIQFGDYTAEIHVVNADGSGHRRVLQGLERPVWSPDGYSWLARPVDDNRFVLVDVTTGATTQTDVFGERADWQPITGTTGHVRPKGASPLRLSLVPAYAYCFEPNRTHGPPLASESCSPPTQVSGRLTVGTPDANGRPAKSVSYLRFGVRRGNPSTPADEADVRINPLITDVREQGSLGDYEGELGVRASLQITDRDNASTSAGPDAATTQIGSLAFEIPCVATADTTVGATCEAETTLEAFVPGVVKENQRAVWAMETISVLDGGADGDADTADGDAVFLSPGVFIP